jgi:LEA14-like dessication related protein
MTARPRPALPALLLAALVALPGCALFQKVLGAGFERPQLTYESWSADALDLDGVTVVLHYRLDNPNDVALDLRRLAYRLEVEDQQVAAGELPGGVQLKARGATALPIAVRLRWRDVPGFVQLLTARSEVAYRVSGDVGVGTVIGTIDLPFEHRDRVTLPRPPSFGIEGVTVQEASLSQLALDLRLRVENPNAFPLPVGALTYGLRVGERDLVTGGTHPLAAVPPRGHAVVLVPIRISTVGAAAGVVDLMRGAELRLKGLAGYGPMEAPVDAPGAVRP